MRLDRILIIAKKELEEVIQSKYVVYSLIFLPVIMAVLLPLSYFLPVYTSPESLNQDDFDIPGFDNFGNWQNLSNVQRYIIFMTELSNIMFLFIPIILPTVLAADTFSGEKDRGTSEGLVASPVSDSEIYIGKVLSSLLPTILMTYLLGIVYVILVDFLTVDALGYYYLPNLNFVIIIYVIGPLLGLAITNVMVWISTKTDTSRDAQQIGGLVALPFILFIFGSVAFALLYSQLIMLLSVVVLVVANYFLIKIGIGILDRENWVR